MNVASKLFNTNYFIYSYLLGKFTDIYMYIEIMHVSKKCVYMCVIYSILVHRSIYSVLVVTVS